MAKLIFYGGVGSVTGANFMLKTEGTTLLVDCGLVQGDHLARKANAKPFSYNPKTVDTLLVTHAHADHIGLIPKLFKAGFKGTVYSTLATKDLAAVMFKDAYKIMCYEEKHYGTPLLYEEKHIADALRAWQGVSYLQSVTLSEGITAEFTDAGHILGSAMVHLSRGGKKIVFTGDIGNNPQPLLNPPAVPIDYDYLLMESVYGDREHEEVAERTAKLQRQIETTTAAGGALIIPAFSLERTQGILFEINNLVESGTIKPIPTFLDSPLAIAVTDIYRQHQTYLKDEVQKQIAGGDDIFDFSGLSFTRTVKASKEIAKVKGAKIIIAGSGMSHGGRVLEHEKQLLKEKSTTLLLVGYQPPGSLGRLLEDGAKRVKIDDKIVSVKATIAHIKGYSGHADRNQLVDLVAKGADEKRLKKVFVTMGEERSSLFLVQRLRDYLGIKGAVAPSLNETAEIDF